MMEFLTPILTNLVHIAIAAAIAYVCKTLIPQIIPWLKNIGIYKIVCIGVRAAEKLGETGQIPKEKKKEKAEEVIKGMGIEITPLIDAMIEAAVEELDAQKGKISDAIQNG